MPTSHTSFGVNGSTVRVDAPSHEVLADTLHRRCGLTSVKQACSMGNCGTCTVRLDGATVYSCLVLTAEIGGAEVGTVESVSSGDDLHPVQTAFAECDGLQCGFCTPGQVLSAVTLLETLPAPTDDDVTRAMIGNLCRCGAYAHIHQAVLRAAEAMR